MTAHDKATCPDQADHMGKVASKLQINYTHFLRKLQGLRSIHSFPFIVVGLGYVAFFALFILWRISMSDNLNAFREAIQQAKMIPPEHICLECFFGMPGMSPKGMDEHTSSGKVYFVSEWGLR